MMGLQVFGGCRTRHMGGRTRSLQCWLCPGGGAVGRGAGPGTGGGAHGGGAALRAAAEREEEIGQGFRGRGAAEPVPGGTRLVAGVRAGKARGARMVQEDREWGLGRVEPSCLPLSYRLGPDVCTILRLSGPLKEQYAKVPTTSSRVTPRRAVPGHCRAEPSHAHTVPHHDVLGCAGQFYHTLCRPTLVVYHTEPWVVPGHVLFCSVSSRAHSVLLHHATQR